jgi:membrane protein DedA with SNARE-associated domain
MESFLIHWGYAAIFLFGFLEACCVPIPSEVTFGFAGVLAYQGHLSIVGVILVGTLAELIGSFVAYAVGRAGGRPLVHRFGKYVLVTQADVDRAERFVAGRGIWAIPLGRALPVVRTFVSIASGIIEVPALLFGVLSLIGTAVYVTAVALIGYALGDAWTSVAKGFKVAGYGIAAVVILAIVAFVVHRFYEFRRQGPGPGAGPDSPGRHERPAAPGRPGGPEQPARYSQPGGYGQRDGYPQPGGHGQPAGYDQPEAQPSPRSPMP